MSNLVVTSLVISVVGVVMFGWLTVYTYKQFRRYHSEINTWIFVGAFTFFWASVTLLVTAIGAAGSQLEADHGVRVFISHVAVMMRGGFITLGIGLLYGWRKLPNAPFIGDKNDTG